MTGVNPGLGAEGGSGDGGAAGFHAMRAGAAIFDEGVDIDGLAGTLCGGNQGAA